ncbi:MAG: thioesterase, partial [Oscillospiraceae bacterium]|nr:thioesterase [Oscillospiraceae bacterium]
TQQASTEQCISMGLTNEVYEQNLVGFLLAKTSVEMHGAIYAEDILTIRTEANPAVRAVYNRYTQVFNQKNELVATVDSRWVLVNTQTKRILRQAPEGMNLDFGSAVLPKHNVDIPKTEVQLVDKVRASFSKCDLNRHLNNTYYVDLICDTFPISDMIEKPIKKVVLNYHSEILMGSMLEIYRGEISKDNYYILGSQEGKKHFEARVQF